MKLSDWEQLAWAKTLEFISSGRRNAWLDLGRTGELYVRNGQRFNLSGPEQLDRTFEIANISITERHRGKGWFKRYLRMLGEVQQSKTFPIQDFVVIESVQNPNLLRHLNSRGWLGMANTPNTFTLSRAEIANAYKDVSLL
jgi:hypothetical protein